MENAVAAVNGLIGVAGVAALACGVMIFVKHRRRQPKRTWVIAACTAFGAAVILAGVTRQSEKNAKDGDKPAPAAPAVPAALPEAPPPPAVPSQAPACTPIAERIALCGSEEELRTTGKAWSPADMEQARKRGVEECEKLRTARKWEAHVLEEARRVCKDHPCWQYPECIGHVAGVVATGAPTPPPLPIEPPPAETSAPVTAAADADAVPGPGTTADAADVSVAPDVVAPLPDPEPADSVVEGEPPELEVDYTRFDDIKLDGREAFGRTALIPVWRGNTESTNFTAYPCEDVGGIDWVTLRFTREQRDAVREVPTEGFVEGCQLVRFKILGLDAMGQLRGQLLGIEGMTRPMGF